MRGQNSLYHNATLVTLLLGKNEAQDGRQNDSGSARPSKSDQTDQIEVQKDDIHIIERFKREQEFLQKKLARSENYRQRLENTKELNAALHHKIIQEVDAARREIQDKEAALSKSEEKYRRIVETTGEGFILMDQNLAITDVNNAYCRMLGYASEELLGKTPLDLATEEYKQFLTAKREDLLSRDYREFEGAVIAKDGREVPILVHSNILKDDHGKPIGQMAFVTDMTEHKKALALAAEVQKSLLPQTVPLISGLDIAGRNVSCDEIGGDYFDYLWSRENLEGPFRVVVGDITGHGVDAALLMTSARAFLRMRASQPGTISQVVTEMNRHLSRDVLETGRFMTLFFIVIDPDKGRIQWVRAGHDPAVIYDPTRDRFEELKGNGLALGVDEKFVYEENRKSGLNTGQIIAIGTDGIWETYRQDGEMFGKDRFREIIRKNAAASANEILNAVYSELNQFTEGLRFEDDITLVVVKVVNK
jgi:sigma-B regulation protein RsbU (phosphoserine phosphatase)